MKSNSTFNVVEENKSKAKTRTKAKGKSKAKAKTKETKKTQLGKRKTHSSSESENDESDSQEGATTTEKKQQKGSTKTKTKQKGATSGKTKKQATKKNKSGSSSTKPTGESDQDTVLVPSEDDKSTGRGTITKKAMTPPMEKEQKRKPSERTIFVKPNQNEPCGVCGNGKMTEDMFDMLNVNPSYFKWGYMIQNFTPYKCYACSVHWLSGKAGEGEGVDPKIVYEKITTKTKVMCCKRRPMI